MFLSSFKFLIEILRFFCLRFRRGNEEMKLQKDVLRTFFGKVDLGNRPKTYLIMRCRL